MTYIKQIASLLACILIALFATPALAHEGDEVAIDASANASVEVSSPKPPLRPLQFIKAKAQDVKQGVQNGTIEMRADANARLQASSTGERPGGLKALIRLHGGLIKERLMLAQRQFENLARRIQSRLDKMKAAGADTTEVQADLDAATVADAQAKVDAQAVADFVATADDATDRAAFKAELEAKIKTAQASIKAAHKAILKTVRALVALNKTIHVETTTSASTSVQ